MAEAEQEIVKLFRRMELLQVEAEAGDSGLDIDIQSKIFRLYGMIEWLLRVNGDWFLEGMEDATLAARIKEGLEEAKEQLGRTAIRPMFDGNLLKTKNAERSSPECFKLPRLVLGKILNVLNPEDLTVAKTILSEVQYFPQPLIYLQLEAVFPILMQKNLLEPKDVMYLSGVSPYVCDLIVKYYEDVLWKDEYFVYRCLHHINSSAAVTLEDLIGLETDYQVVSHVRFELNRAVANDSTRLHQLRICGKRILHCALSLDQSVDYMERLQAYLELMPNLKTLSIEEHQGCVEKEIRGLVLPELRFLRNLVIYENFRAPALQRMLLRKYGDKLELVTLHTSGEPKVRFQLPETAASLTVLKLSIQAALPVPMQNWYNNFRTFANCPLKEIELEASEIFLRPLLVLLGKHWKDTLEVLEIQFYYFKAGNHQYDVGETTWMIDLRFPKLRRFKTHCYPLSMDWSFLLLFPVLEELMYSEDFHSEEDDDFLIRDLYVDDEDDVEPVIMMPSDRNEVLRSNLWKLFPRLEKVEVNWGIVTRKECLVAHREM